MAKKSKDQSDGPPPIADVAKPGQTPSPPTSRPVITGHGPMVKQDPMVSGKPEPDKPLEEDKEGIASNGPELVVNPDSETEETEQEKPSDKDDETTQSSEEQTEDKKDDESADKDKSEDEQQPAETDSEKPAEDNSTSDSAAIDSLATSAEAKKLDAKQAEEDKKRNEKVQELVAGRKYAIPIVEGGHKASSQRFVTWLLLILLLAVVGVYLAIDAGYLDVGIALPFDLIKN